MFEPSKPVVAVINGYDVADRLELSLLCGLRMAENSSVVGIFCCRFGVL